MPLRSMPPRVRMEMSERWRDLLYEELPNIICSGPFFTQLCISFQLYILTIVEMFLVKDVTETTHCTILRRHHSKWETDTLCRDQ